MSFSCPELNLDEMLAVAKKYGYDGIEPRIGENHKHGIELDSSKSFRKECRQKSEESGIQLCCIATSCRYADPEINKTMISDTHKAIDLAGDVGAPDDKLVMVPIGEGYVDHRRAVELLKADKYDGFLSGEWINWEPYETHLLRELTTMKRYEHDR